MKTLWKPIKWRLCFFGFGLFRVDRGSERMFLLGLELWLHSGGRVLLPRVYQQVRPACSFSCSFQTAHCAKEPGYKSKFYSLVTLKEQADLTYGNKLWKQKRKIMAKKNNFLQLLFSTIRNFDPIGIASHLAAFWNCATISVSVVFGFKRIYALLEQFDYLSILSYRPAPKRRLAHFFTFSNCSLCCITRLEESHTCHLPHT